MKYFLPLSILLSSLTSYHAVHDGTGHPIENVISLLKGLSSKSEMEGKHEALTYEKFEYWCRNSVKSLEGAISEEKETIEKLEDKIAAKIEEKASLEEQIATLTDEIDNMEASGRKAKDERKNEHELYKDADADFTSTIEAVKDALKGLEGARDKTEADSFIQRAMPFIEAVATEAQTQVLQAFIQQARKPAADDDDDSLSPSDADDDDDKPFVPPKQLAKGDRAAHVDKYASKSHSVIELLKGLVQKFEDEKLAANDAETNGLNAYDVSKEARDNAITAAEKSKKAKEVELQDAIATLGEARADLKSTQQDLDADSKSLSDTQESCNRKAGEWAERSKTREEELEAIAMAIKILAKSAGVRTEAPSNPVPPPAPFEAEAPAFLQLPAHRAGLKAVQLLRKAASVAHSSALARLAEQVSLHLADGPFEKVNNMIEKMIFHLMNEQKQEDDHKNWCDLEVEKTNTSIVEKATKVAELNTKIRAEQAKVQKLTEEIMEATEMVAEIVKHMAMAEEVRAVGKKENELAIADSESAQSAVADATAVLEAFYKESGKVPTESYEFVQGPVELGAEPSTWDAGYTGIGDPNNANNGIIAILQRTATEFSQMEADTRAQEASDQKDYEESMKDCKIEKTRRESEAREKTQERKNKETSIASMEKVRKHTADELEKTQQYMTDLQPACVEGDSTYEDRKAARTQEVVALQQAQVILADAFKEKPADNASGAGDKTSFLKRRHAVLKA